MSEKSEETQSAAEESEKKQQETNQEHKDVQGKPAETQEEHKETSEKDKETQQEPPKAKKTPTEAMEKPLEKMTVKELREMAKDIPGIAGVHAMKKEELLVQIKAAKGIVDEPVKKADASVSELKQKIKALKVERQAALEAKDKKKASIFRRRISRLKKKTRRVAA
jgi:hypothetical protein